MLLQWHIASEVDRCLFTGKFAKKVAGFAMLNSEKIVSHASKTWEKESINCLECCENRFMEELIIKLYSKNNCGLRSDQYAKVLQIQIL